MGRGSLSPKEEEMFNLYQQLTSKYPHCVFGYVDNGLAMQLSVVSKRYKKNNAKFRVVELGLPSQDYANQYMDMIREIHDLNVSPNLLQAKQV
jgi:hypothetical protein